MFSWCPSSLSRIKRSPVFIAVSLTTLLVPTLALARGRSHGHPRGGHTQPPRANPATPHNGSSANANSNPKVTVPGCDSKATLTIATYNVENFWDDVDSNSGSMTYDEYQKGGSNWYNDKMYTVKAQQLTEALKMAGTPDIVAMQEFESGNNASRSLEILKPYAEALGYKFFALGLQNSKNPVAVTTAVMSKYPIQKNEHLDFNVGANQFNGELPARESIDSLNSSARDPQVVTINVEGQPLRLYTAHWKSRRGNSNIGDTMRTAVAELMKQDIDRVKAIQPNLDVLVMGDFNSDYNERSHQYGLNATDDKNNIKRDVTSDKLYNLWFELPSAERCSYMHSGMLQCLDHILTNSALFDGQGIDLVENSFQVVGHNGGEAAQKLLRNDGRTPNRWGMQKNQGRAFFTGTGYSDHLPLVATFKIPSLCSASR